MQHSAHSIDVEKEEAILRMLFDLGRDHQCINCVLTAWINIGSAIIGSLPRPEQNKVLASATLDIVTLLTATAAEAENTEGMTKQ